MVTLVLLVLALGALAASAVAASHSPVPVSEALPVGVLGLAWRSAGTRPTRYGTKTLWLADAPDRDAARYSRAYSAGRDALRAVGFSWDSLTPVVWKAVPAPADDEVLAAVAVAGTPLTGGKVTVWGAVVGAVLLKLLQNTLITHGVAKEVAQIIEGAVIVAALWLQRQEA